MSIKNFKFGKVENASKLKCDRMMPNQMQCNRTVTYFVNTSGTDNTTAVINLCEAHFQIALAKAEAALDNIIDLNTIEEEPA